jgi:N-acetyl-gamma-glutamylphosphate reductase
MRAAIVGASGFVGQELVRTLADHPEFELVQVQAHQRAGARLGELVPGLGGELAELELGPVYAGAN